MKHKNIIAITLAGMLCVPAIAAPRRAKGPTAEELMKQATEAFYAYRPAEAQEKIAALRKLRKGVDEDAVDALEERVNRLNAMIQRVEDITIIDSMNVKREDFFKHYRLSAASGTLMSTDEFRGEIDAADSTVVYMPESGASMIWGSDKGLMAAHRLTDGTWEAAEFLGENLNAGGIANYPFLMPDGVTLYYASDGDDSLGGLDLYISRRNGDEYPAPQNMGMPYNSPYDDYMLAIDEETGAGWWASDRNQLGDYITIYVFAPNESRVNIDVNDPQLAERAGAFNLDFSCEDSIRSVILDKISGIKPMGDREDMTPDFELALPDGRVYTHWSDFRNPQARRAMETYVDALDEYGSDMASLEDLRSKYRPGRSDAQAILTLEKKVRAKHSALIKLANQVITYELK